ncbi:MAG: 50S ribosomal protein L10 [Armatimonadota bacterium]|nr:50S ribosomal protein L10 [Armatimonadota bacterium]
MRRDEKEQIVGDLQQSLDAADNLIISGYRGLAVKDITGLRRGITDAGGRMRVVKKTLLLRALEGRDEALLAQHMEGPIAVTFVSGDPMPVLKSMSAFARTHEHLEFKGGWIEGQGVDGDQLVEIASLPPREELLARLLASVQWPLTQLAATLQAVPRDLVLTLQALAEQRAGAAGAQA